MSTCQRRYPPDRLAGNPEDLAARGKDLRPCAHAQKPVRQLSRGLDDVLAIVEDKKMIARSEVRRNPFQHGLTPAFVEAERIEQSLGDKPSISQRGEVDKRSRH